MHAVIPETAQALVIEHAARGDDRPAPPLWDAFRNPCLLTLQLLTYVTRARSQRAADRVASAEETTVAEEVASERGLSVAYTDISHRHRVAYQPWYLTLGSWAVFLALLLGWTLHLYVSFLALFLIPVVAIVSQRIHNRMREQKMACDLRQLTDDYTSIVFFAGESHLDPVADRLAGAVEIVEPTGAHP